MSKYAVVPPRKVNVVWADHFGLEINEPYELEEIEERLKPCIRETIGYLVAENRRVIAVAGTKEEDGTWTEVNFFMKRCVMKIEEL